MSKKNEDAQVMKFSGIFEFRIRNPDEELEPDEIDYLLRCRIDPEMDQSWFLGDDRVPVAEFDTNDILGVYEYFAEENGNGLLGGLQGRGLKESDVIVMRPRLIKRDKKGEIQYQEYKRRLLLVLGRNKLAALKKRHPKLNIATRSNLLNGLVILPDSK